MADSDEHTNDEYQIEDPSARLLSPAEKKEKVDQLEHYLGRVKAQAAARSNAVEAHVKDMQANERDACAELEAKFQSAEAKVQSAEKAVEEAKEYRLLCRIELNGRKEFGSAAIRQAEKNQLQWQARADAKIRSCQEALDEARQEMVLDASSTGESG